MSLLSDNQKQSTGQSIVMVLFSMVIVEVLVLALLGPGFHESPAFVKIAIWVTVAGGVGCSLATGHSVAWMRTRDDKMGATYKPVFGYSVPLVFGGMVVWLCCLIFADYENNHVGQTLTAIYPVTQMRVIHGRGGPCYHVEFENSDDSPPWKNVGMCVSRIDYQNMHIGYNKSVKTIWSWYSFKTTLQ